jgi:hypothetical protein
MNKIKLVSAVAVLCLVLICCGGGPTYKVNDLITIKPLGDTVVINYFYDCWDGPEDCRYEVRTKSGTTFQIYENQIIKKIQ